MVEDPVKGATYIVDGIAPIAMGPLGAVGIPGTEWDVRSFDKMHRGGWDPHARREDMATDGIRGEVIYPSVGMALYSVPDGKYMSACMDAYNRWLHQFCASEPNYLFGIGQSAGLSPDAIIKDMQSIKSLGLKGVMMPSMPEISDWDDPIYDEAWAAAVELGLPLSFHVLPHSRKGLATKEGVRGSKLNNIMSVTRTNQDIVGVFVFGGVFERNPRLNIVSVEADAGWAPHYAQRMNHAYDRFRAWLKATHLNRAPSEYFFDNVYLTFQDDLVAVQSLPLLNPKRLMWATDFPHPDSTWPKSLGVLSHMMEGVESGSVNAIVRENVVELYGLKLAA
jgi:predicted TIM-barrel fold metal-dependent hydrolase